MYRALFCLAYYGLMRIGELANSPHSVKARNVHVGTNKDKIMLVLYSSKTHGTSTNPQKIKISVLGQESNNKSNGLICPFESVRNYLALRGSYDNDCETSLYAGPITSHISPGQEHSKSLPKGSEPLMRIFTNTQKLENWKSK